MKKLLLISGFMMLAVAVLGSDLKTPAAAAEQKSESHKMIRKNRKHMERPVSLEVDASGEIHGEHRSMGDHANMVELEVDSAGDVRPAGDESAAPISGSAVTEEPSQSAGAVDDVKTESSKTGKVAKKAMTRSKGSAVTEEPSQTAGANDLVKTDSGTTGKVAKKAMTRSKGKKHDFSINEELAGLDDEDAEKLEEKEAVDKVEHLAGLLSEQGMGSKKEEKKLRKEIIEGKKGEEVLSEMEDIMSSIDDDAVDDVVKAGLSPTDKDLLEVERYELDKPDIPDPEEAGRKMEEKIGASELEDKEVIASNDTKTLGIRKWAEVGGKIPIKYCRAGKTTNKAWSKFKDATQHLTKACTKLQFIETNAGCQMKVEGNGGCWSHLGYIGGRNVVNLQDSGGGTCAITGRMFKRQPFHDAALDNTTHAKISHGANSKQSGWPLSEAPAASETAANASPRSPPVLEAWTDRSEHSRSPQSAAASELAEQEHIGKEIPALADPADPAAEDPAEVAFRALIGVLGPEEAMRDEIIKTPKRAAKAWRELNAACFAGDPKEAVGEGVFEDANARDLVVVRDMPFQSMCEHHLLPFWGTAHVAYLPNGRVLGLSKFARLLHAVSRRPNLQERLTRSYAEALEDVLHTRGLLVVMKARHSCMSLRGVQSPAATRTIAFRGLLKDNRTTREDLMMGIGMGNM